MKLEFATGMKSGRQRRAGAFALLCLFLAIVGMAQFESSHRAIHSDAGNPEHRCAASLMQAGQLDFSATMIETPVVRLELFPARVEGSVFHDRFLFILLRNRGPPEPA